MKALAQGASDPAAIAALAVSGLQASPAQLADALQAATSLSAVRRQILGLFLERLALIDQQRETLAQSLAESLREHQAAVTHWRRRPAWAPIRRSRSLRK